MTTLVNCRNVSRQVKDSSHYVYIGRPSKWGNPYKIGMKISGYPHPLTRLEAIQLYEQRILNSDLMHDLPELVDKILGCWCPPLPCHGDVLVQLVQRLVPRLS